jgi:Icc-related predicted phosphoesterase
MLVGCEELLKVVYNIRPQLHAFGHIHESYGQGTWDGITFANASICTGLYKPTNAPFVFNLTPKEA